MGSSKKQLILQFLGETFLLTTTACIISFCLAPLLLKLFADFIPPGLQFQPLQQPYIFLFLLLLALVVSVLSGLYPAFILSGYKPVNVLKNQSFVFSNETRHAWIRKTLTVSQFIIAQFFVIATVMVSKQINYSLNADMGFRKDAIVSFDVPRDDTVANHRTLLLNEIRSVPGVQMASRGFLTPADEGAAFTDIKYEGAANGNKESVQLRWGDTSYLKLFNIKLLAGRNVQQSDTIKEFLINETYAKLLGFKHPEDALGKQLDFNDKKMPIVGVMHDFNEQSFHSAVGPLVFAGFDNRSYFFHILLQPQNATGASWPNTIAQIQKLYHQIYPDADFSYKFLDDTIAKFYETEQHTASLLSWATGSIRAYQLSWFIGACDVHYQHAQKRDRHKKDIRCNCYEYHLHIIKRFCAVGIDRFYDRGTCAWWATYKWLQDFAYRTTMNWWVFALCGFVMLLIALITLSIQTIRAAVANPVESLRTE
jgi:hypothetical protein